MAIACIAVISKVILSPPWIFSLFGSEKRDADADVPTLFTRSRGLWAATATHDPQSLRLLSIRSIQENAPVLLRVYEEGADETKFHVTPLLAISISF